jgi:integrase
MASLRRRGHIRKRGNRWVVVIRHNGKQEWTSFETKGDAEHHLAKKQAEIAQGSFQVPERVTFGEAAAEWIRHGENEGGPRGPWKASTRRDNRSALRKHFVGTDEDPGWLRDLPLARITPATIETWRRQALATGMSRRTAAKLTAILHGVFEHAREAYRHPTNPVASVKRLAIKYDGRVRDFYSPEEVHAIIRAADNEQDGIAILVAAFTGLRRGELLALRWRDVDFVGQVIRVEHSYDHEVGLVTPKSHKMRSVPMSPKVAQALARLELRGHHRERDDFVFVGQTGGALDGSALRRRYDRAVKRAKVKRLTFHELRHTFGTVAAKAALSGRELQEWLGHADLKTTQRYLHYRARGDEANRLAAAFAANGLQTNDLHEPAATVHPLHAEDDAMAHGEADLRNAAAAL